MSDKNTVVDIAAATAAAQNRKARGKNGKKEAEVANGTPAVVEQAGATAAPGTPAAAVQATPARRVMKNEERHVDSYKPLRALKVPVAVAAALSRSYKELGESKPTLDAAGLRQWLDRSIAVWQTPGFADFAQKNDTGGEGWQAIIARVEELYAQRPVVDPAATTPATTPAS